MAINKNLNYDAIYTKVLLEGLNNTIMDILKVGAKKPMGYITENCVKIYSHLFSKDELTTYFESNGLKVSEYPRMDEYDVSGYYFVWDEINLSKLLKANNSILHKYGLTESPSEFVALVGTELVSSQLKPDLYCLVAYAFADYKNNFVLNSNVKINPAI